ncbi:NAD(P)-dependent oxidoreductase [uncultured Erythrobacter sp.]|uniref:NAD-dependent epimerase/dehydratase family protein n=1 Tax=uncultured Erythrobacter sp. TaxID=263913 RepID=UPI002630220B|nr:NAD(P)-dependent oxidoreductase [uncultured Erythrobacter sp.]
MKIILTGSSGRIGRAIFGSLAPEHEVIGVDTHAFSTTQVMGDCADEGTMRPLLESADAVIHTAGPHAPHVGEVSDDEFERVNVQATGQLYEWARASGVGRYVYTSTTALYGHAIVPANCTWVDETTAPLPKSIYHRSKLAGEERLEALATIDLPVRVLRMSRCFPENAALMATYRLHRGVDARDVGEGHRLALDHKGPAFTRFILSGATPFTREDCEGLVSDAPAIIRARAPKLARAFATRGWDLPRSIDRVYDPGAAQAQMGWRTKWGWEEVLAQLERNDLEVLPYKAAAAPNSE